MLPRELNYRMPAEWEPHEATWLAWPHNSETWPGKMDPIPKIWIRLIEELSQAEKVNLLVNDLPMETQVRNLLAGSPADLSRIRILQIPTDDCWMRDAGPIFVVRDAAHNPPQSPLTLRGEESLSPPLNLRGGRGELLISRELAITNWTFNKWGGKYPPWELDNQIPNRIAALFNLSEFKINIVLEGGSIDVNGKGCLLTTESCLLNKNRNPSFSRTEIETALKNCLGVKKILWLGDGIAGDDTDGHIDDLARFVSPDAITTVVEEDPADENYKPLQDNLERLKRMTDTDGRPFTVVPLPMPGPLYYEKQRLPASYANFYIANSIVIVPTYRHPNDPKALAILQKCFPSRKVVGMDATDLAWGLGAFHCITRQQPAV